MEALGTALAWIAGVIVLGALVVTLIEIWAAHFIASLMGEPKRKPWLDRHT